jgi:hypothetical protein
LRVEQTAGERELMLEVWPKRPNLAARAGWAVLWAISLLPVLRIGVRLMAMPLGACMLVLPVLHLFAGGWLLYDTLRKTMNWARLKLDSEALRYGSGPVPPRSPLEIPTREIERFEPVRQGRSPLSPGSAPAQDWGVQARLKDDHGVTLPLGLESHEHAVHVADRLQNRLVALRTPDTYRA